jgi:hypothetical protein
MAKKGKGSKTGKGRKFKFFQPFLVGDYAGTIDRDARGRYLPKRGGIERIDYNYPQEPGGLEEGIMGIPMWALLLGSVLVIGGFAYAGLRAKDQK